MNRPVIFEDEALQFVRDARKVSKSIILPCNPGTIEYSLRNVNYDGIYESEWKPTDSRWYDIGLSDREMAKKVYKLCNKYNTKPHLKGEKKIPVVFINCRENPFVEDIMQLIKKYETRNRDTLHRFLGERVLLAETGRGLPLVRCYATIGYAVEVYTRQQWEKYRSMVSIPVGSSYDWKPGQKKKVLYHMEDVQPLPVPFRLPPSAVRHGRTWAELELPV